MTKPGLWANIHAKRERIAAGSGERMRKPGTDGAPSAYALRESAGSKKINRALRAAKYADGGDVNTADVLNRMRDTVTNRATLLPLADYADGSTRLAWPGIIHEPAAAWKRMVDEGPTAEDSFTVASAVPIAGLAAAAVRPGTSLGSGGGKLTRSLPMDEASRMARAREMGYDTDRVFYHGSPEKFDAFSNAKIDPNDTGWVGPGHYFTTDKDMAAGYGKNVVPVYLKRGKALEADDWVDLAIRLGLDPEDPDVLQKQSAAIAKAFSEGKYNSAGVRDYSGGFEEYVMPTGQGIRRVDAAFDPDFADSANLLAANSTRASAPGLAALESNRVRGPERAAKLGDYLAERQTRQTYKDHNPKDKPVTNRIMLRDEEVPDAVMEYADLGGKAPKTVPVQNVPLDSLVPTQGSVDFDGKYALRQGFSDQRPINVVQGPDGRHYVLDGHHRMMMRRLLREREIPAKIEGVYDPVAEAVKRATRK